jgi:hypothetical protein
VESASGGGRNGRTKKGFRHWVRGPSNSQNRGSSWWVVRWLTGHPRRRGSMNTVSCAGWHEKSARVHGQVAEGWGLGSFKLTGPHYS